MSPKKPNDTDNCIIDPKAEGLEGIVVTSPTGCVVGKLPIDLYVPGDGKVHLDPSAEYKIEDGILKVISHDGCVGIPQDLGFFINTNENVIGYVASPGYILGSGSGDVKLILPETHEFEESFNVPKGGILMLDGYAENLEKYDAGKCTDDYAKEQGIDKPNHLELCKQHNIIQIYAKRISIEYYDMDFKNPTKEDKEMIQELLGK